MSPLGAALAEGRMTVAQFAAYHVANMQLPNPRVDQEVVVTAWRDAGLRIKPLQLILQVVEALEAQHEGSGYLTPKELHRVVVPLAGAKETLSRIVEHVLWYRTKPSDFATWPDCAPRANDFRMLKEFLLFLDEHGYLQRSDADGEQRFFVVPELAADEDLTRIVFGDVEASVDEAADAAAVVERERKLREVVDRPGQKRFKKELMAESPCCFLSAETVPEVLHGCHIKPVNPHGGPDSTANGLILRHDIHTLWDAGLIRIAPDGCIHYADSLKASPSYGSMPANVDLPEEKVPFIEWRWKYL